MLKYQNNIVKKNDLMNISAETNTINFAQDYVDLHKNNNLVKYMYDINAFQIILPVNNCDMSMHV